GGAAVCSPDLVAARAGVGRGGVAPWELLDPPVFSPHRIVPGLTGFSTRQSERPHAAMPGQDRAIHPFQETDGAPDAIAGVPAPAAAGTHADVEILKHDRIAKLENLRTREPGVGHVSVHSVGTREARTGR